MYILRYIFGFKFEAAHPAKIATLFEGKSKI